MPKVSIIIPNYNHARYLRRRIESVLRQTFPDFELILLDDCSTDKSRTILLEYSNDSRVRVEFSDYNSGTPFRQWNKGVRLAQGEYIWIAESDDYADERFLERLIPVLDKEPSASFVYCRTRRVTADDRVEGFGDWYLELVDPLRWQSDFCVDGREHFPYYFARSCVVANASSVLFRKSVYERIGGADETFRVCGDWKVWTAMALKGKVAFVNEHLNFYRDHDASAMHQRSREAVNVIECLRVVDWILEQVNLSPAELEKVYNVHAGAWVPALISMHFPLRLKRTILKHVRQLDPHPMRRIARPALSTVQRKIVKHWRSIHPAASASEA